MFSRKVSPLKAGLLELLEHTLRNLIRLSGLHEDVVLRSGHHFLSDIGVADDRLRVLNVFGHGRQIVGGAVKTAADSAQRTTNI